MNLPQSNTSSAARALCATILKINALTATADGAHQGLSESVSREMRSIFTALADMVALSETDKGEHPVAHLSTAQQRPQLRVIQGGMR